jgi:hypothetical protein
MGQVGHSITRVFAMPHGLLRRDNMVDSMTKHGDGYLPGLMQNELIVRRRSSFASG